MSDAKKILIHICCAPCATSSAKRLLLVDGHKVRFYFSNSNIHSEKEYLKGLEAATKLARILNVIIEKDEYVHDKWLWFCSGTVKKTSRTNGTSLSGLK